MKNNEIKIAELYSQLEQIKRTIKNLKKQIDYRLLSVSLNERILKNTRNEIRNLKKIDAERNKL